MLGLDTPRVASAEAACAVAMLQPAETRPPKDPAVPRAAWETSSGVIPYSSAWVRTAAAPPAMFMANPSPRPVVPETINMAATRGGNRNHSRGGGGLVRKDTSSLKKRGGENRLGRSPPHGEPL